MIQGSVLRVGSERGTHTYFETLEFWVRKLARFEQEDGYLTEVEVYEVLCFVCDV